MLRSDGNRDGETAGDNAPLSVDRRSYLKLAGVAAGSASLLSGAASAAFTRRGIRFERTVDMVGDAGCDPSGNEPCDQAIRNAADDYTLLRFPAGEYKITDKTVVLGATNLGFLGEGDVSFVVPERFNEKVVVADKGTGLLFENIDIDQRAAGATPGLHSGPTTTWRSTTSNSSGRASTRTRCRAATRTGRRAGPTTTATRT